MRGDRALRPIGCLASAPIRVLLLVVLLGAVAGGAAGADDRLPIFDAHMHFNLEAWPGLQPYQIEDLMDRAGVSRALVSSTPDDGTVTLHAFDRDRFVPELRPYAGAIHSANWYRHPAVVSYLEKRLASGIYRGIGEFHFYPGRSVDTPQVRAIAAMARSRDILLHVHSGAREIDALFAMDPALRILWAHAGMSEPAAVVADRLGRYANLAAELSFRAEDILVDGALDPGWRTLLIEHAERFVIGTDTYVNSRWVVYEDLVEAHRAWLSLLPRDAAKAIAYENAERMFEKR